MICSISLEEFKIPIVLSCGHTFEKEYIEKIMVHKCPLCRKSYYIVGKNWAIIDYMGLDKMDDDDKSDIKKATHYISKITKKILKRSLCGYSYIIYKPSFFYGFSENVCKIIEMEFKKKGFHVRRRLSSSGMLQIHIIW